MTRAGWVTTHEERAELDRVIEEHSGKYCDDAVDDLTDEELRSYLEEARNRLKKKTRKPSDEERQPMYVTA